MTSYQELEPDLPFEPELPALQVITQQPKSLDERLEALDDFRGILPNSKIYKIAWDIRQSAKDCAHLGEYLPPRTPRIAHIQKVVATHFNVSRLDMQSARRTANVVRPRQIAMYLCRFLTLRSLPEIGRMFGGRDHTTVLHGVRKITGMVEADKEFAAEIDALKGMLG